jgi:endo-1,4-beta-D-glucanase Y
MSYQEFEVEPDWKSLAQRYRKERDAARKESRELARQYSALAKRVAKESAEKPCFSVWQP